MMARRVPIYAKLSRPHLARLVPRERLFTRLDELRTSPVVWVCGPPGAGKTALVASYLDARKLPSLWYQVDAGEADPATFFYYLSEAAARLRRGRKTRLPLLTPEYLGDVPGFTRRFFRALFARFPQPGVLVLDNFQEAGDQSSFAGLVRDAFGEVPPQAQVFVLSRSEPGEAFARLRAGQNVAVLDWDELKLAPEEAFALAGDGNNLGRQTVTALHEQAQGWAAGFVLLVEHAKRIGATLAAQPEVRTPQGVFDYFAGEVFATLPAQEREVLLHLGFLPHVNALTAQAVSGSPEAGRLLEFLYRRHLFTDRRAAEPPAYQFHPLFREFLTSRARAALPSMRLVELVGHSGRLMEEEGQIEAAAQLYAEAGDWAALIGVVEKNAGALLAQGRNKVVENWISVIPAQIQDQRPWLVYWLGLARIPLSPAEGRGHLERAHTLFKRVDDPAGRFLACAAILQAYFFEWSGFVGEDPWIREMEELVSRYPDMLSPEIEAKVVAAGLAVLFRAPAHPMLDDWARRGLRIICTTRASEPQAEVTNFLVQLAMCHGDFPAAEEVLRKLHRSLDPQHTPPVVLIGGEMWAGILALLVAEHSTAFRRFDTALEIGCNSGIHVLDALTLGHACYAALSVADLDGAAQYLERMEAALLPWRGADMRFHQHLRGCLALLRGDLPTARRELEARLSATNQSGSPWTRAFNWNVLAKVLIEQGELTAAREPLRQTLDVADAIPADNLRFSGLLVESDLLLRSGDEASALAPLRRALALGRQRSYWNITPPIWQPQVMSRLCALALEHGIEPEYVTRLIRRRAISPPASSPETWPWPVKIYTLGRFSPVVDDVPLRSEGKGQRKTLDLLQALIALGGRDVDVTALTQALWPDAEGDAAHHALETGVHRLRKLIGKDAVAMHGGRITLDPQRCWVDAWALERIFGRLNDLLREGADAESIRAPLAHLQSLYKGPFLGQESQPWLLATRERLRGRYLRIVDAAAERFEQAGQWHEALELLHRGIDLDPFTEAFYRRLMVAYQRLGRPAEALSTWRRCQRTLSAGLGIGPSPDTEAIARQLQQ